MYRVSAMWYVVIRIICYKLDNTLCYFINHIFHKRDEIILITIYVGIKELSYLFGYIKIILIVFPII